MRIVGIDPGSLATGFGVIEKDGQAYQHVGHGTLRPRKGDTMAGRMAFLYRELSEMIQRYQPDVAAIEKVFISASPRSALVLGQARGVALAAVGAAGLVVHEFAPREIKQSVAGTGAATKLQVQSAVARMLTLEARPGPDAADALAAAICQGGASRLGDLGVRPTSRRGSKARWSELPPRLRGSGPGGRP